MTKTYILCHYILPFTLQIISINKLKKKNKQGPKKILLLKKFNTIAMCCFFNKRNQKKNQNHLVPLVLHCKNDRFSLLWNIPQEGKLSFPLIYLGTQPVPGYQAHSLHGLWIYEQTPSPFILCKYRFIAFMPWLQIFKLLSVLIYERQTNMLCGFICLCHWLPMTPETPPQGSPLPFTAENL